MKEEADSHVGVAVDHFPAKLCTFVRVVMGVRQFVELGLGDFNSLISVITTAVSLSSLLHTRVKC